MRPKPSVDSKKTDIAVAKAITPHETPAMPTLCAKFKIGDADALTSPATNEDASRSRFAGVRFLSALETHDANFLAQASDLLVRCQRDS